MTATERRQALLETLCVRRYETRENLAFEFDVSLRTIDRDIEFLSVKYPIITVQGNGGGIRVVDRFYIYNIRLDEAQMLFLKGLLKRLAGRDREIMIGIIKKIGDVKNE